jgi:hypothetical protein
MKPLRDYADSVAIVVSSCDAFFDAWQPFAFFFRKHWPHCPFPVHLIVNELQVKSRIVHALPVGPDQGWATNMQKALAQISAPYILYFQEITSSLALSTRRGSPAISATPSSRTRRRFASATSRSLSRSSDGKRRSASH